MELTEEQLRSALKELRPSVEQAGVLDSVLRKGRAAQRRDQFFRAAQVLSVLALVVVGALGMYWLARDLPQPVASTSPVSDPVPSTSTLGEVTAPHTPEVQGYLDALEACLRSKGIAVVSVSTQSPDAATMEVVRRNSTSTDSLPLVCVRVAGLSVSSGPDGYSLVLGDIERQAAIMGTRGVPIRYVAIVSVAADGSEKTESVGLVADLIPQAQWLVPPRQALDATRQAVETFVQEAAGSAGVDLTAVSVVEDDFGRTVTVQTSAQPEDLAKAKQFAESLDVPVRALDETAGSKIVTLVVKVDTPTGSPLVRVVKDYALANGVSSVWTAH